jgi:two-component system, LytTR family, sensor histidine kinase AlgZ
MTALMSSTDAEPTAPETAPYESTFLPDFCSTRMTFLALVSAELLACILMLASGAIGRELWVNLALISIFIQWIALGNILMLCFSRPRLKRMNPLPAALSYYGLSLLVTLIVSVCAAPLTPAQLTMLSGEFSLQENFIQRNLLISTVVSVVTLRYFYMQHQWKQNIVIEVRSHIQALRARIRPHFLFNSMNAIASLTRTSPGLVKRRWRISPIWFRAPLGYQDNIKLDGELAFARRYINIEEMRLGDRLKIE